ncbi:similar to Saccharomyces cerevisiae YNL289W PCL1 Cyclin, interacts with cyclin-dependent kinase Pho85p [Maudiozyma saulgeensis]|uniref:Similar to Saccharomyces cerevisiae YNL289W PCL1 Cyclin, interacts with cyclin-dependent kinase Pho85p n=1 Tax=Maudiozyma saulgeensis TaxID=1789683 RepID=A0A1X7R1G5_9SACH|nr:similar to Saccharomyces cerevisiae YNL289W PCL1 Cyclin, interacts with cyclin-dependent kinase Pho85p [Kazachstania saulgeensis]
MSDERRALYSLMRSNVTEEMIIFLTECTSQVIKTVTDIKYPSPPNSPNTFKNSGSELPSLSQFIKRLVQQTNVYTPTLLTTATYLRRLKAVLPKDATGVPSTTHRMFLACLILSAKNHNDSSPLNKHWTKYTNGLFTLEDVNLMERQLLQLLNWNMVVKEDELIESLQILITPIIVKQQQTLRMKSSSPIENAQKSNIYKLPRNESYSSEISSSSTLIGSQTDLRRLKQQRAIPEGSRWNLEQVMSRYGF